MHTIVEAGTCSVNVGKVDPATILPYVYEQVAELITSNPHDIFEYYDLPSLFQRIQAGKFDLWLGVDGSEIELAAILSFEHFPVQNYYRFIWLGGSSLDKYIIDGLPKIEKYAHVVGAQNIALQGRSGWVRKLQRHGYNDIKIEMRKNLTLTKGH